MSENKIILTLLNGTGYVFDVNDYMELREKHRIIGSFVGSTNVRFSTSEFRLPAELTIFETRLAIEEGFALLVSKEKSLLNISQTSEDVVRIKSAIEERLTAQAEVLKAEKIRDAESNIERIVIGKRNKLLEEGKPQQATFLTPALVLEDLSKNFVFDKNNALLEIPCACVEPHVANLVQLPELTSNELFKYRVLYDFWKRGKYVTPGDAFGADFLIYPGDPLLFHATHIVIVFTEAPTLEALNLITKVRLAVMVNKICVLAYKKAETEDIQYQTLEWDGNLEKENHLKPTENISMSVNEEN